MFRSAIAAASAGSELDTTTPPDDSVSAANAAEARSPGVPAADSTTATTASAASDPDAATTDGDSAQHTETAVDRSGPAAGVDTHSAESAATVHTAELHTRESALPWDVDTPETPPRSLNTELMRMMNRIPNDNPPDALFNTEEPSPQSKVFMISVKKPELKARLISSLEELGATVSDTNSYDPSSTHLLCLQPVKKRKYLSCIAAGKWILHFGYVNACMKARKFLNEEEYEFGNPKFIGKNTIEVDREYELKLQAIYDWRNEIARTGRGAFDGMRTIIIARTQIKEALVCIIQAGGGTVVEATPPFDDVPIDNLTHCLMEAESISSFSLYEPLAKQGIYCASTEFVQNYLYRTNMDIKDAIFPFYQKYFRCLTHG